MRLRTSTRLGIGSLAVLGTVMLLFVSVTLFLRASSVVTTIEDANRQFEPVLNILVGVAGYQPENRREFKELVERSIDDLAKSTPPDQRTRSQQAVIDEGQRWIDGESVETTALREYTTQLALDAKRQIDVIQESQRFETHITILLSSIALLFGLFFIRYLLVRLVNPLEEVFHYVESRPASDESLPRFVPLPAVDELDTIEESIQALGDSRRAYVSARNAHVPFGDQTAVESLLERIEKPVWVLSRSGAILGANDAAIDVLAGADGHDIRNQLYELIPFFAADFDNANTDTMDVPPWWDLEIAPNDEAMICILREDVAQES